MSLDFFMALSAFGVAAYAISDNFQNVVHSRYLDWVKANLSAEEYSRRRTWKMRWHGTFDYEYDTEVGRVSIDKSSARVQLAQEGKDEIDVWLLPYHRQDREIPSVLNLLRMKQAISNPPPIEDIDPDRDPDSYRGDFEPLLLEFGEMLKLLIRSKLLISLQWISIGVIVIGSVIAMTLAL